VEIEADVPSAGWVVISDTWYPGWRASVDGEAAQILHANYLFRGLYLEPGEHTIVLAYQPVVFWTGLALSMIAWTSLLVVWWRIKSAKTVDQS
jgi:uncharacterized membrane protein YfhO